MDLDRLDQLERRIATLENETIDDHSKRTTGNSERLVAAARSAQPVRDPAAVDRADLVREAERMQPSREWLIARDAELRRDLAAMGEEPKGNDFMWRRRREDLLDTIAQVRDGVMRRPAGELYALAKRDGIARDDLEQMGGLDRIERRLAEIDLALRPGN